MAHEARSCDIISFPLRLVVGTCFSVEGWKSSRDKAFASRAASNLFIDHGKSPLTSRLSCPCNGTKSMSPHHTTATIDQRLWTNLFLYVSFQLILIYSYCCW